MTAEFPSLSLQVHVSHLMQEVMQAQANAAIANTINVRFFMLCTGSYIPSPRRF